MVLDTVSHALYALVPQGYLLPTGIGVVGLFAVHALAQGRKTTRERDLHGRVALVSGAFTPLGLTLVQALAERGAHVIALAPEPIASPRIDMLVDALRARTSNERIFAEHCDLSSPRHVRAFCTKFLTGTETRLDALVFAHEYAHVGSLLAPYTPEADEKAREDGSMATFLLITLLLPALLVVPTERDIRVVSVINPFYAAAAPSFRSDIPIEEGSTFLREGRRSLRTAILMRHLQRVLDALPNRAQAPAADAAAATVPVVDPREQRSNIVALAVSPGTSRADTVHHLLGSSRLGLAIYIFLYPLIILCIKSSRSALQTVLHALFLPTPYKVPLSTDASTQLRDEVLKPGALYAECAVVPPLPIPALPLVEDEKDAKDVDGEKEDAGGMAEDGELGGVRTGTAVWEHFERALKAWEAREPPLEQEEKDEPTVDATPSADS